jgi:TIGR03009 family protein
MEQVLARWEQESTQLKSLDVQLYRIDKAPAWGQDEHYQGRALLKSPNFAWLDLQKIVEDPQTRRKTLKPFDRIVCTGNEVWQYKSDTHQIFIYPLEKQPQKRALEEGPLPFLFNMRAREAKQRYQMSLVSETPTAYVVSVRPLLSIDQESFSKAFVQLQKSNHLLPSRIYLVAPDGTSSQDYRLSNLKPNAPVMDENFQGKVIGPPWTVVRNPGPDGQPAATGRAPVGAPARQPALRQGVTGRR